MLHQIEIQFSKQYGRLGEINRLDTKTYKTLNVHVGLWDLNKLHENKFKFGLWYTFWKRGTYLASIRQIAKIKVSYCIFLKVICKGKYGILFKDRFFSFNTNILEKEIVFCEKRLLATWSVIFKDTSLQRCQLSVYVLYKYGLLVIRSLWYSILILRDYRVSCSRITTVYHWLYKIYQTLYVF